MTPPSQIRQRFETATGSHRIQFKKLLKTRSVGQEKYKSSTDFDYDSINSLLEQTLATGGLLFYNYAAPELECWLFSPTQKAPLYSLQFIPENQLDHALREIRLALEVDDVPNDRGVRRVNASPLNQHLNESIETLTNLLLPDQIRDGLCTITNLIVVPVRNIGTVPFGILRPLDSKKHLIDLLSISIAPSLQDLLNSLSRNYMLRQGRDGDIWSLDVKNPLIVGNPSYLDTGPFVLPQLPGAEAEVTAVADLLAEQALLGPTATLSHIRASASLSDVLYFATHGIADPEDPLDQSGLFFANSELWTAREIQSLDLSYTDLVILSACQTGLGGMHDAGIIGLARSFILAGASDVIMSLWNVDDAATEYFMRRFVSHLVEGSKYLPAGALKDAMIKTRDRYPHPSRWAAFTHFGVPLP